MGDLVDAQVGQLDNPEGYPRCPWCKDFVAVCASLFNNHDLDHYYCDTCKIKFPLSEAIE